MLLLINYLPSCIVFLSIFLNLNMYMYGLVMLMCQLGRIASAIVLDYWPRSDKKLTWVDNFSSICSILQWLDWLTHFLGLINFSRIIWGTNCNDHSYLHFFIDDVLKWTSIMLRLYWLAVAVAYCSAFCSYYKNYPDSKVHGANMGPIWGRQDPGGSHVGHMNFAIWVYVGDRFESWQSIGFIVMDEFIFSP